MEQISTIIISRTDKIGDFVVSIPSYATAKAMYPQARIVALVSNANRIVAEHVGSIDEVISIDEYKDNDTALIKKLRELKPDVFVALVSDNHISTIAKKSGAKVRIGPHSKMWSFLHYNKGFRQKRSLSIKSEAEYNLDLIKHIDEQRFAQVGIHFDRIAYTADDAAKADELIASLNLSGRPFILINPFTGGSGSNLSEEHYSQVIEGILNHENYTIAAAQCIARSQTAAATSAESAAVDTVVANSADTATAPSAAATPASPSAADSAGAHGVADSTGGHGAADCAGAHGAADSTGGHGAADCAKDPGAAAKGASSAKADEASADADSASVIGVDALVPEVVVMGIASQLERIERVVNGVPEGLRKHVHICINNASLMVAAALTQRAACFIGPSTGITQFAGNYRKPVICFYSSRISNSHTRWALFGDDQEYAVTFDRNKLHAQSKELLELKDEMRLEIINKSLEQFYSSNEVQTYLSTHQRTQCSADSSMSSDEKKYEKLSLTVALIAHNEADRLPPTLAKIQDIASEIIVINSVSTDKTIDVARSFGAKVYTEEFKGFVKQKNSLIPKCTQDWILFLDADEVLNDELKDAIVKVIKEDSHDAYEMNRLTFYLGKLLKHAWQPNYRLRLVRRDANPRWEGELVHESLNADAKVKRLPGYIIHYSYRDVHDHFLRTVRYAKMSAQSYVVKGKKASLFKIIFSPFFSFIKLYFIKLGFLDGRAGYIAAQSAFIYTFLKYVFLWEGSKGLDYKAPQEPNAAPKTSSSSDTSAAYVATLEQQKDLAAKAAQAAAAATAAPAAKDAKSTKEAQAAATAAKDAKSAKDA